MNNLLSIKKFIIRTPVLFNIVNYLINVKTTGTIFAGTLTPENKRELLLNYAKKFGCRILVETGTYKGDTLDKCQYNFDKLYSIELSHDLYEFCKRRFENNQKITIFEGDSSDVLPKIAKKTDAPILFWLDAHYSAGETARGELDSPVLKEVEYILDNVSNFCILIDDARYFKGKNGYPTINYIKEYIKRKSKLLRVQVKNDIIRISNY